MSSTPLHKHVSNRHRMQRRLPGAYRKGLGVASALAEATRPPEVRRFGVISTSVCVSWNAPAPCVDARLLEVLGRRFPLRLVAWPVPGRRRTRLPDEPTDTGDSTGASRRGTRVPSPCNRDLDGEARSPSSSTDLLCRSRCGLCLGPGVRARRDALTAAIAGRKRRCGTAGDQQSQQCNAKVATINQST